MNAQTLSDIFSWAAASVARMSVATSGRMAIPAYVFHCYVVADIVGQLEVVTSGWRTTSSGRGRIELSGKCRGPTEVIEWKDLINDARARNRGFINAAGLSASAHSH